MCWYANHVRKSEESSNNIGLGIFDGEIVNLKAGIKKLHQWVGLKLTEKINFVVNTTIFIHMEI